MVKGLVMQIMMTDTNHSIDNNEGITIMKIIIVVAMIIDGSGSGNS